MRTIELTEVQRERLMDALEDVRYEDGAFDVEVQVDDNITVTAVGRIEVDGYREDDYYNGTGAWVETYRMAWVELTAYNEDGDEFAVDIDSERQAEAFLNEEA